MFMDRNIQYCHIVDMSLTVTCNSTSNSKFMKEITDFFSLSERQHAENEKTIHIWANI